MLSLSEYTQQLINQSETVAAVMLKSCINQYLLAPGKLQTLFKLCHNSKRNTNDMNPRFNKRFLMSSFTFTLLFNFPTSFKTTHKTPRTFISNYR